MKSVFHAGEREVQRQAGVERMARRLENGIHDFVPPVAQEFLSQQSMVVVASVDTGGQVWASLLTGEPGFVRAIDELTVFLDAEPLAEDPLHAILKSADLSGSPPALGLLAIDLATRRRMRVNGQAERNPERGFFLHVQQVYANCPKYIQMRTLIREDIHTPQSPAVQRSQRLTALHRDWIAHSDTFFIASFHSEGGADASHRGGQAGFVQVENETTLLFPDYAGNNMFNTLGNLAVQPRAGLLFVNFETGDTLQVTGQARTLWDAESAARFPGAQRAVAFEVATVIQTERAAPLRWQFVQASPFNPA